MVMQNPIKLKRYKYLSIEVQINLHDYEAFCLKGRSLKKGLIFLEGGKHFFVNRLYNDLVYV